MEVIGRQHEQERVDEFLDLLTDGPAALVLEGDPGIGKTTVWRAAVDAGRHRSYRVLICRASESESALSFLGLCDLLESLSNETLELLPEPQRLALELAVLRRQSEGSPDRVTLARGTLNVLRTLAAEAPTVLAIDDVQWLDPPTADVLRFVAHRLIDERLGLLVSARGGEGSSLGLEQAFPAVRFAPVRLEPLSFEELEAVVRLQLPGHFALPTWRALHRISGGNPFVALQLAEALERRGRQAPGPEPPIPETLADAMRERLRALSPNGRAALLIAAAMAQPTLSSLPTSAAEAEGVEEAVQAGVLQIDGERVRFAHPLLASFVYAEASDAERRAVHAQLVLLAPDPEERTLHLGRGTSERDESTGATLEAAAERAAKRGHPEIAAELAEHAARLTPAKQVADRARRTRYAASFQYAAGDRLRSCELLEDLVEQLPRSAERARALALLGWFVDDIPRCIEILEQGLEEAGEEQQLRSRLLSLLAMKESWGGKWSSASRHLREAIKLAERSGGDAVLATARARLAWAEIGPAQVAELERAAELERSLPEPLPFAESPSFLYGVALLPLDQLDEARQRLEESYERGVALGDSWRNVHLAWLAELELRDGNWERAHTLARAAEDLGRQVGGKDAEAWGTWSRALVEAHLGHVDAAVEAAERAARLANAVGLHWARVRVELSLGFLRLSEGREASALDHLLPLLVERGDVSLHASVVARTLSNTVEALVVAGELSDAEAMARRLDEHAVALPVPSALAAAARCRALVLARGGDLEGARSSVADALSAHARLHEPFELARTYLAQGSIERRAKQRAAARAALGRAEAIFAELGARLWLEKVQRELARTGLTRSLDRELTPTELRMAELAAAGAQNKQIAGELFVSVKTVESNLSRVYAKLGIRSRVELPARLSKLGPPEPPQTRSVRHV